jgi:hypothetical protein
MRLDPLPKRASERLVRDALGDRATDDIVQNIVARAEGNALFLEELVRAAANHDVRDLPIGVLGTLQLRFDGLSPQARSVLRAASVFGELVTRSGLLALLPTAADLDVSLAELVAQELFRSTHDGYAFRHALTRDAAYALLVDEDRVNAHALAASWLATQPDPDPAVIAHHYGLARKSEDAAHWHVAAATRALARNNLTGAIDHARRAEPALTDPTVLGELDMLVAEAELGLGNLPEARDRALLGVARLAAGKGTWFVAAGLVITAAGQLGDNALVAQWVQAVLANEPHQDDDASVSGFVLALTRGSSQLVWADYPELSRQALMRAMEAAEGHTLTPSASGRLEFARAYHWLVDGRAQAAIDHLFLTSTRYADMGASRDAIQMRVIGHMLEMFIGQNASSVAGLVQCISEASAIGARFIADWARFELAMSYLVMGRREDSERELANVPASVKQQPLFRVGFALMEGWDAVLRDDMPALERLLEEVSSVPTSRRYLAGLDAFRAYALAARGARAPALELALSALRRLESKGDGVSADTQLTGATAGLLTLHRLAYPGLADEIARVDEKLMLLADSFADPERRRQFFETPWIRRIRALRQ